MNATAVTIRRPPFHEALERLRQRRGLSYRELGERSGISKNDAIMFCKGENIPTPRQFCRMRNVVFRELAPYREDLEAQWERAGADTAEAGHDAPDAWMRDAEHALETSQQAPPVLPEDAAGFGEALRRARVIEGLSQDELGQLLGVTGQAASHWEGERNAPVRELYVKLLDLFPVLARCPAPQTQDMAVPDGGRGDGRADSGGGEQPAARFELPRLAMGTRLDARPPGVPVSLLKPPTHPMPQGMLESYAIAHADALVDLARARAKVTTLQAAVDDARQQLKEASDRVKAHLETVQTAEDRTAEALTALAAIAAKEASRS